VTSTLARRPHFREGAELNVRLISRYFDGASVGLLVMDGGHMTVFAASDHRWRVGTRLEGALSYAVDVVESGSTLIAPDLGAIAATASRQPAPGERLLVAVPLQSDGVTIGALALADRRKVAFDVQDLAILEHVGARFADVFAGRNSSELPREPGVLIAESWRFVLRCELEHLQAGHTLAIALASVPASQGPTIPVSSPGDMATVTRTVEDRLERLPPRTALGRLGPATLAVYGLAAGAEEGTRIPPRASRSAIARPIPLLAPVIKATAAFLRITSPARRSPRAAIAVCSPRRSDW
jgi:hypothetical protein